MSKNRVFRAEKFMAPRATAAVRLTRFVQLPSREVHVSFDDCSTVVLNPSAGSYLLLDASGAETRGLCACAAAPLGARLGIALHLRNALSASAPRLHWRLLRHLGTPRAYFDHPGTLASASWPRAPSPAHVVRHAADGATRVLSLDRRAWLLLHPDGHSFAVCFPVSAGFLADLPRPTRTPAAQRRGQHDPEAAMPPPPPPPDVQRYVFFTQLHSATSDADVADAWQHPLRLARAAAAAADADAADTAADADAADADADAGPRSHALVEGEGWEGVAAILGLDAGGDGSADELVHSTSAPLSASLLRLAALASATREAEARRRQSSATPAAAAAMGGGGDDVAAAVAAAYAHCVDADVVRVPLPAPVASANDLRLRARPVAVRAATAFDTELPPQGACIVLTPHALIRLRVPPSLTAPPQHAPPDDTCPLTMHLLSDETHLRLAANQRFWVAGGAAAATAAGTAAKRGAPAPSVYAVGAVPPGRRYPAVGEGRSGGGGGVAPASLLELTTFAEQLWARQRSLPRSPSDGDAAHAPPHLTAGELSADDGGGGGGGGGAAAHGRTAAEASRHASGERHQGEGLPAFPPSAAPPAACLVEQADVEGVGRFRLFGDGRVSVLYNDGAVLTMRPPPNAMQSVPPSHTELGVAADAGRSWRGGTPTCTHPRVSVAPRWMLCDVLLPDGRQTTVRSTCPIGAEGYVHAAVQFHAWACKPLAARLREFKQAVSEQQGVDAELSRIQRHLWSNPLLGAGAGLPPPPWDRRDCSGLLSAAHDGDEPAGCAATAADVGARRPDGMGVGMASRAPSSPPVERELARLERALRTATPGAAATPVTQPPKPRGGGGEPTAGGGLAASLRAAVSAPTTGEAVTAKAARRAAEEEVARIERLLARSGGQSGG